MLESNKYAEWHDLVTNDFYSDPECIYLTNCIEYAEEYGRYIYKVVITPEMYQFIYPDEDNIFVLTRNTDPSFCGYIREEAINEARRHQHLWKQSLKQYNAVAVRLPQLKIEKSWDSKTKIYV